MNKILLVARREYLATVRRKAFIIVTLGMPIFFTLLFGLSVAAGILAIRADRNAALPVGIVDEAGLIRLELLDRVQASLQPAGRPMPQDRTSLLKDLGDLENIGTRGRIRIRSFASQIDAKTAYLAKEVRGYYIVPANYLETGAISLEIRKGGIISDDRPGWTVVQRLLQASLLDGRLEATLANRIWTPPQLKSVVLQEGGLKAEGGKAARMTDFALPYFFTIFFMLSILGTAGYLLQGVAEEKENRVIEILVSSLTTDQLLAGKVLGLCAAGLTQLVIWILIAVAPSAYVLPTLDLRWGQLGVALVFFLLGFLMFGTVMGGVGALGNNYRESQQLSVVWTLSAVSPFFFLTLVLQQPNGVLARVLSYIPLTAPVTMMLRISAARVPLWDVAISALILSASLYLFVRMGGKLFRVGVLMYGKRPTLVEIVRWLRAA